MEIVRDNVLMDMLLDLSKEIDNLISDFQYNCPRDYKRLDQLVSMLESTDECRKKYNKLKNCYTEIRSYLPADKLNLITRLDDCFTEILVLFEEYFYTQGIKDGKKER